ncbi:MAG: hypothetical protein RLZZ440_967 [Planctomycetota bacterium]
MQSFRTMLLLFAVSIPTLVLAESPPPPATLRGAISGIHPHLSVGNAEGECGIGGVVPWAGRLWVITYGPHLPRGSSDKLWEITSDLRIAARPESIGGTPASRMIHAESQQLLLGPYLIDAQGEVRTVPYDRMPGRHTGFARHLTNPAEKVYVATMEEGLYELDVTTLAVQTLIRDGNPPPAGAAPATAFESKLPGYHGKGCYSGQGRVVYANNGDRAAAAQAVLGDPATPSGALAEWRWPGEDWKLVRRNQFTEVTGPGGIFGNQRPESDPIWSIGWDHRSLILMVLDRGRWHAYRLPKVSHSYDGAHGWNTEWPRIRDVGEPDLLMTMHGCFWRFPRGFSVASLGGLRPRSAYLKVIGDFCRWHDSLVFGCDDAAAADFKNKRKAKGSIAGPARSNSNLWFTDPGQPDRLGPPHASGAVWLHDDVAAGTTAEPLLVAGWQAGSVWFVNGGEEEARFDMETETVAVPAHAAIRKPIPSDREWLRVTAITPCADASVVVTLGGSDGRGAEADPIFQGLATIDEAGRRGGLLHGGSAGADTMSVVTQDGLYVLELSPAKVGAEASLRLVPQVDPQVSAFVQSKAAIPTDAVTIDAGGVLVVDDRGRRWRLPKHGTAFDADSRAGRFRFCREVVTERDLFQACGILYELPAENAGGFAVIRPVATHDYAITDYASYKGLLVLTGLSAAAQRGEHVITSDDGKAAVWVGAVDDLWRLGRPRGTGGPWVNAPAKAGQPSDPFLLWGFDDRRLNLCHDQTEAVTIQIEIDLTGSGLWIPLDRLNVPPGPGGLSYHFDRDVHARWVRLTADRDCSATSVFELR